MQEKMVEKVKTLLQIKKIGSRIVKLRNFMKISIKKK